MKVQIEQYDLKGGFRTVQARVDIPNSRNSLTIVFANDGKLTVDELFATVENSVKEAVKRLPDEEPELELK